MKNNQHTPDIMGEALGRVKLPKPQRKAQVIELPLGGEAARRELSRKLSRLGLSGMARALSELGGGEAPAGFEEKLARLVDRELREREERQWRDQMEEAGLPYRVDLSQVDFRPKRGLVRPLLKSLATGNWIGQGAGVIISGPTGVGKSFLACAIAGEVCREGFGVLHRRLDDLIWELAEARAAGAGPRPDRRLLGADLLILDNWGMSRITPGAVAALAALLERRWGMGGHLIVSQRPPEQWRGVFPDSPAAAGLLDRLTSDAYQIKMSGRSMRSHFGAGPGIALDGGD